MRTKVGICIDHRKAVILSITRNGEQRKLIKSKVEKQPNSSGDPHVKGPHEALQVPLNDSREASLNQRLNIYYDEVIASIRNAESILILGTDEAKDELKKRIEKINLSEHIVNIEKIDKITVPQFALKVRRYYQDNIERQPGIQ